MAVVLDFSKYMARILEIDPARRIARVQPGVVLDHLRNAAEKHHLTFAPDPASHERCTIGGMIGNNSCGVHSVMAGKTDDNIEELEIVTYDGTRLTVGRNFIRAANEAISDQVRTTAGRRVAKTDVGTATLGSPGGAEVSGRGSARATQIYNSLKQIPTNTPT